MEDQLFKRIDELVIDAEEEYRVCHAPTYHILFADKCEVSSKYSLNHQQVEELYEYWEGIGQMDIHQKNVVLKIRWEEIANNARPF